MDEASPLTDHGWTHVIEAAGLPPHGREILLETDAELRKRLAEYAGIAGIPALEARLKVAPDGDGGVHVSGKLHGSVRQTCIVSLEEFDNPIRETIEVFFAEQAEPSKPASGEEEEDEENSEDGPDPILDGKIDLGALAAEFLLLAIDPYPRRPGVVFQKLADEAEDVPESKSPFDALSALKNDPKKSS